LSSWNVFEEGAEMVAALEEGESAEEFQNDEGEDNRQRKEEAQLAFNIFFHGIKERWRVRFSA